MSKNVPIDLGKHPRLGFDRQAILKSFIVNLDSEVAIFYYDINVYDSEGEIIHEMTSKEVPLIFEKNILLPLLDVNGDPVENPDRNILDITSPIYLEVGAFEMIYDSLEGYLESLEGLFNYCEVVGHLK